jgi:hypothetical protein
MDASFDLTVMRTVLDGNASDTSGCRQIIGSIGTNKQI